MSRTGSEAKPTWQQVPRAVRQRVVEALAAPVKRAMRIWGGYTPTPTFRLALADGRRAFFKGTFCESNEISTRALQIEIDVYQQVRDVASAWMPQFYATFEHEDWRVLLLEDLGPKSVPPWTRGRAKAITQAIARFHQATLGKPLPDWLPRPEERLAREDWARTVQETEGMQKLAALAKDQSAAAAAWWQAASPVLDHVLAQSALREAPYALLHGDLRSDNLRFHRGRLSLFDWPAISVGRPEWEIVPYAQSVAVEGGPPPDQILTWYHERLALDAAAVEEAIAWWVVFFAARAWQEEIPGLPRVRRFQRQQLAQMVGWASRQWDLPQPDWVCRLQDA